MPSKNLNTGTKKHRGYFFDFVLSNTDRDQTDEWSVKTHENTIKDALNSEARYVIVLKRPIHESYRDHKNKSQPKFFSYRGFIYYDSQRYPTQLLKILPTPCYTNNDVYDSEDVNTTIIRSAPTGNIIMTYSPNYRKDQVWFEHNKDNVPRGFRLVIDDENCSDDEEDNEEENACTVNEDQDIDIDNQENIRINLFGCEDLTFINENDSLLRDMLKRQYGGPRRYAELVYCDENKPENQTVRYRNGDDENLYVRGHDGCWVRWNKDMITETIVTNAWTMIVSYYDTLIKYPERLKEFRNSLSLPSLTYERIKEFVKDFKEWMKNGQLPFMFADVQKDVWRVIQHHWEEKSSNERLWIHENVITADQVLEMHLRRVPSV
jgi:hypothetical protein